MPYVQNDQLDISYKFAGSRSDPPIILISSLGTDLSMWDEVVSFLAPEHFVVTLDYRGHGASRCRAADYMVADLAGDVLAVAEELNLQTFDVCGVSLGGIVGLWLALHQPRRINCLIAANTSAYIHPPEAWQQRAELVRTKGMGAIWEMVVERFFSPSFRQSHPECINDIKDKFLAINAEGYAGCCAAIRDFDIRDRLQEISRPSLVISGSHDIATPTGGHSDVLVRNIPGAAFIEIDAGHISAVERPQEFAGLVQDYLKNQN